MPARGPLNEQFVLTVGLAVLSEEFRNSVLEGRVARKGMQSALSGTQFREMTIERETLENWQALREQLRGTPVAEVLENLFESCERIICARGCRIV